jgi:RNA polymerase II subunit A small phosphatase-like protein
VSDRHLLILDLDETLVFASESAVPRVDFRVGSYEVMKRPHVDSFLSTVSQWFDLAVWTSSSSNYARVVVAEVFSKPDDLKFLWCSDRCTLSYDVEMGKYSGVKSLRKIKRMGYSLDRVLVLDDTPAKHVRNYGNLVPIKSFEGEHEDVELREVLPFLEKMRSIENVRRVEKRFWRNARR